MNDLISRQAAIDALHMHLMYRMGTDSNKKRLDDWINGLPSAQETHEERAETHACDCISRQAAIEALCDNCDNVQAVCAHYPCKQYTAIDALPSAEPENIRCKDCKWFENIGCAISIADDSDKPTENDFCSFAERREG